MKLLELFSGAKSVGKVAEQLGYEVVSLDLKDADINCDILEWDYTTYPVNYFDIVWASPPCTEYSRAKTTGVRKINEANKIVLRTLEIIGYLNPTYFIIENPQTGLLKEQCLVYLIKILIIVNMVCFTVNEPDYGIMYSTGYQDLYAKKIVIVWTVIDIKQLLNGCQVVENKIGVINHCLVNLICMLFLKL